MSGSTGDLTKPLTERNTSYGSADSTKTYGSSDDTTGDGSHAVSPAPKGLDDLQVLLTQYDVDGSGQYHRVEVISIIHDFIAAKNDAHKIEDAYERAGTEEYGALQKLPVVPLLCALLAVVLGRIGMSSRHRINNGLTAWGLEYVAADHGSLWLLKGVILLDLAVAAWAYFSSSILDMRVAIVAPVRPKGDQTDDTDDTAATSPPKKPKKPTMLQRSCGKVAAVFFAMLLIGSVLACFDLIVLTAADTQLGLYTQALCNATATGGAGPRGQEYSGSQVLQGVLDSGFQQEHEFLLFLRDDHPPIPGAIVHNVSRGVDICGVWTGRTDMRALSKLRKSCWMLLAVQLVLLCSVITRWDDFRWSTKTVHFMYDLFGVERAQKVRASCWGEEVEHIYKPPPLPPAKKGSKFGDDGGYGLQWDDMDNDLDYGAH